MSTYRTVVVGTDGSDSSFLAVDRAAQIARDSSAALVVVYAFSVADAHEVGAAQDALRDEAYLVTGSTPAEETVRTARERARRIGAGDVETVAVPGDPADVLVAVVADRGADLLVVGNRGLNTLAGRLLGSVPSAVSRRAPTDVLIVHTTS